MSDPFFVGEKPAPNVRAIAVQGLLASKAIYALESELGGLLQTGIRPPAEWADILRVIDRGAR